MSQNPTSSPEKVSGFVINSRDGRPTSNVTVRASIEFENGKSVSVGALRADRNGYVSFSIPEFLQRQPKHIWLESTDGSARIDALTFPAEGRVVDFLLEGAFDDREADRPKSNEMVHGSIQEPDASDARRSPDSIAIQSGLFLGEEGCEIPIPNTQVEQEYDLRFVKPESSQQSHDGLHRYELDLSKEGSEEPKHDEATYVLRTLLKDMEFDVTGEPASDGMGAKLGSVLTFRQHWRPLGHSLGRILYSLALAPCEAANIAVIDWSRSETGRRDESTSVSELLNNELDRDRTIDEVVQTTLSEYQGGIAAGGGVGGYYGVAFGAGAATSHSWGVRSISGNSTQDLTDTVTQVASSYRGLQSTVVRQTRESERDEIQTRTVKNFNRNHAMTVQYYEVLRHYEVWTDFTEEVPVILLKFSVFTFDEDFALRFRVQLENALLDPRLRKAFDALSRVKRCADIYPAEAPSAETTDDKTEEQKEDGTGNGTPSANQPAIIDGYSLKIHTARDGVNTHTDGSVRVYIETSDGSEHLLHTVYSRPAGSPPTLAEGSSPLVADITLADNSSDNSPALGLELDDITGVVVTWKENGPFDNWLFEGIEISARVTGDASYKILFRQTGVSQVFQQDQLATAQEDSYRRWKATIDTTSEPDESPGSPPVDTPLGDETLGELLPSDEQPLPDDDEYSRIRDQCLANLLVGHLNDNKVHYNRAVWLGQDADERILMLRNHPDITAFDLADRIETTPVGVYGGLVAFPLRRSDTSPSSVDSKRGESKIVTLPGRGVFAETHLSHCPAAEVRDPTRDREMGEGCSISAPPITGVQPGSRSEDQNLRPSNLPAPVVNIQNAPDAPDPTGLASAFGVLGTPNIFRDMSLGKEVLSLVSGLASGAVSVEAARIAAKKITSKAASSPTPSGRSFGGRQPTFVDTTHPTRTRNARQMHDMLKVVDSMDLPQSVKNDIARNWLNPAYAEIAGNGGFELAKLSEGVPRNIGQHILTYLQAISAEKMHSFSHVDNTAFQELPPDSLMDVGWINQDAPFRIKAQAHRAVFSSSAPLSEVWHAVQSFQELVKWEGLRCEKVRGDLNALSVGDQFKFDAYLPAGILALKNAAEIANAASLLGVILSFAPDYRTFFVEVVHAEPPTESSTSFNFGVQTAYEHPYGGSRSWRIDLLGHEEGEYRYLIETMEFNTWGWLPDYILETVFLPMLGTSNPAAETWFHWICNVVNGIGGTFEPNPRPRSGTCPEVEFIDPPYLVWEELRHRQEQMDLLDRHPILKAEAQRLGTTTI